MNSGGSRGAPGARAPLQKYLKKIKQLNLIKIDLSRFEDSILQQFLTEERRFNILLVVNSLGPPLQKYLKKIKKLNLIKIELSRFEDSILQQFLTEERRFNILLVVNSLVNISCTY